ncbi:DUF4492 domain-containing protein [uncultured Alloprevotella sp.]|uniref:DUF4492 domain-containing protein n=1 Tax=uncultured Alloprevotella sp. TaxID=1283315 RepID=UPI002889BBCE|nr:DUF4492 domain-containing protein [uncultured Alloprevotella sp.]
MEQNTNIFKRIFRFYIEGFRNMTWGRTLWLIIILKLFVFFVVLRIFFFQPYYKGLNDKEKAEMVGKKLMK